MKTLNRICQILAIVFGVAALALFIFPDFAFATIKETAGLTGLKLAFGGTLELGGVSYALAKSSQILFCILLNVLGIVLSIFANKQKTVRYIAPAVTAVPAIYMLVKVLSNVYTFVDFRALPKLPNGAAVTYNTAIVVAITVVLFVAVAFGVAHLLIADILEIEGTKKLPLIKRIIAFFKDYKSETKKIVWPNVKTVVKNTFIVLVICALVGGFVCLLDLGLGTLVELIIGKAA